MRTSLCGLINDAAKSDLSGNEVITVVYPKPTMGMSELIAAHMYTREELTRAYRERGQVIARRVNPLNKRSGLLFDTDELEKWRIKQCQLLNAEVQEGRRSPIGGK